MAFSQDVWNQIKATTADELVAALEADGYKFDPASIGAIHSYIRYRHPHSDRVSIHYHPGKSYGPKLLKSLIADAGWKTEDDLARVGLIRQKAKPMLPAMMTVPCGCDGGLTVSGAPCPDCGGTRFKEIPAS
ncbi:MAG: type II toxin-antitoxin system HicA family toxin [Terriglobales bacterium]|jgi:predicted RNA binding protein YcfA (HicA-like mRNA interferase family)